MLIIVWRGRLGAVLLLVPSRWLRLWGSPLSQGLLLALVPLLFPTVPGNVSYFLAIIACGGWPPTPPPPVRPAGEPGSVVGTVVGTVVVGTAGVHSVVGVVRPQ